MSQTNFMRNLRMQFPQYVTNVTSFGDAVRILKSKSILNENVNLKPNDENEIKVDGEEEILALLDKIEQEKAGEEAIMSQYDPMEEEELTAKQIVDKYNEMFGKNASTTFKDVAKALGVDEERVAIALGLTSMGFKEDINEGKGKELHPNKIHPSELRMGIKVELEHTDNLDKAKKIALDHLAENPYYYTALKLSGVESPSKPKEKAKKEVKAKKKKESIQLVDLVNGMKKVKMPKTVKEAMEVDPKGGLINTPDEDMFMKRLQQSTGLIQALSKINSPAELDGLFDAILNDTSVSNISKQTIISALRKVLDQMDSANWSSSKVANKVFSAPQQQALSKNIDKFKESLREMVRKELAEYEKGDENDAPVSKKNAAREITDKAVDYIDDYNEGESKEYKKKWLDNVFDSYENKVGRRYDNDVFQDVIDMLKAKGYTMSMKETFDGRDNLIDPIAAIEK